MTHSLITIIAKDFILIPLLLLLYVWLSLPRSDKKQLVLVTVLATVLTGLLAVIGSKLFYDPRPFVVGHFMPYFTHGNDNGFPSDHSLLAGLLAALTTVYNKQIGLAAYILAVLIGASRVIAGVHHTIDIIGAFVFAGIATYMAQLIVRRFAEPGDN